MDLRTEIYEMLKQGKKEDEIVEFMVDRYGEFVLYRPPLNRNTFFLWVGPFIILLVGITLLVRIILRRRAGKDSADVDPNRLKAAAALLDELLLLRGVTPEFLFGEDLDRNGLLGPNEDDGDATAPPEFVEFSLIPADPLSLPAGEFFGSMVSALVETETFDDRRGTKVALF